MKMCFPLITPPQTCCLLAFFNVVFFFFNKKYSSTLHAKISETNNLTSLFNIKCLKHKHSNVIIKMQLRSGERIKGRDNRLCVVKINFIFETRNHINIEKVLCRLCMVVPMTDLHLTAHKKIIKRTLHSP